MTVLVDKQIEEMTWYGGIVINPFDKRQLNSGSYDVRLGEYYYTEQIADRFAPELVNPWDKESLSHLWGEPKRAVLARERWDENERRRLGLRDADQVIVLDPHETILGHTIEFIGGGDNIICNMQARSSIGRVTVEVCKCAGWGDHGYINRWTMEITNNARYHRIMLIVGRRVAQIAFNITEHASHNYSKGGKYQNGADLNELIANWKPEDMLPKMYLDWENNNE